MNKKFRSSLQAARLEVRLILLAAFIGILIAFVGQIFIWLIIVCEELFLGSIGYVHPDNFFEAGKASVEQSYSWHFYLLPLVCGFGGLLSGLLVYGIAPETENGGENSVIRSFHNDSGWMRRRVAVVKALASAITIGSGGAAGREGPMAQISASIASTLAKALNLSTQDRRVLFLAATAGGISAVFGSPLGAAFLAVEILYSRLDFELEALIYCIIAAAVAYAVRGGFLGWDPLFDVSGSLSFRQGTDLFYYGIVGVLAGALSLVVPILFYKVRDLFHLLPVPNYVRPAVGGFGVGLLGLFVPQILGGGYSWIQQAIHGNLTVQMLLLFGSLKIVAFCFTASSGGSGGVFAPVLFTGAMFGGLLHELFSFVTLTPPGNAALVIVSMAAFFAGIGRAPVATLVVVLELTGGHSLMVPTMFAVALSFVTQSLLGMLVPGSSHTLYSAQVPTRMDSKTHQQEYLQMALDIVQRGGLSIQTPISFPDLDKFLELGHPLPVGDGGDYLYGAIVPESSEIVGQRIRDLSFVSDILIVSIEREGQDSVISPRGATVIEQGDQLILICQPESLGLLKDSLLLLNA